MRLLPRLLESWELVRLKGDLPCWWRRQRKAATRKRRTAPAATPVAMPAMEALWSWLPPDVVDGAAVAADVDVDVAELALEDAEGWLAIVMSVDGVDVMDGDRD